MEWTIILHEEDQYAEIVTSGIADRDGSLAMAKAISMTLSKKKLNKLLVNHGNLSAVSGGVMEIYHRPDELKEIGVTQNVKVAEVVRPEHKRFFDFLETVCVNRGYSFSIFDDRKSALEWLLNRWTMGPS